MKRILSLLAIVALVAMTAQAVQVQSENVAGVINVSVAAGEYKLVGVNLDDMDELFPTLEDVFGAGGVPAGTVVYLFNGSDYVDHIYYGPGAGLGWWQGASPSTATLDRVTGFWITCATEDIAVALTGEVPDYETPIVLDPGYQIVSYPFPAEVALTDSVLGANGVAGDIIYVLDGSDYVDHICYGPGAGLGWWQGASPSDLVFSPGDSFWYYRSGGAVTVDETVPYTL